MSCHGDFEELVQRHWLIATARVNANHSVCHSINNWRNVWYLITVREEWLVTNCNEGLVWYYSCSGVGKHDFSLLVEIFLAVSVADFVTLFKIAQISAWEITENKTTIDFYGDPYHAIPHTLRLSFNNIGIVQGGTGDEISWFYHSHLHYSQ